MLFTFLRKKTYLDLFKLLKNTKKLKLKKNDFFTLNILLDDGKYDKRKHFVAVNFHLLVRTERLPNSYLIAST